jgi:hypothetical protein
MQDLRMKRFISQEVMQLLMEHIAGVKRKKLISKEQL